MNQSYDLSIRRRRRVMTIASFAVMAVLLIALFFISANLGSIRVSTGELFRGLFVAYNPDVATIYDLRFPRIIISAIAGASISVSGVLFQAVLKNPLADPGIIGISSGASFFAILIAAFFPMWYFLTPIFACIGGVIAFFLVYSLSWRGGLSPLRIILVGVAVSAMFSGLSTGLNFGTGSEMSGVASIVNGNITMKTWQDVHLLTPYAAIGLALTLFTANTCNLMSLEDKAIRSLGVNVNASRIRISVLACILACASTAIVGAISFLGLIVPHIGRLLVGSDHRKLLPFSMLFGAFTFLFADTLGRTIMAPYEIPAAVIMAVIGGPFFIILLRRSKRYDNA